MEVSYKVQGRLGNNIFQYIATKLLISLYHKPLKYVYNKTNYLLMLSEFVYLHFLRNSNGNNVLDGFYLDGFFQFHEHIIPNINLIQSFFTVDNHDRLNDNYTVFEFISNIHKNKVKLFENDIVTHVRLDDFKTSGGNTIMHYKSIINVIQSIQKDKPDGKVYVVVDKCKQQFEIDYMEGFKKELDIIIISHPDDLFKDLAYLWYAPNLVCNNSSFCWIAGILGTSTQTWMPKNKKHHICQTIEKVRENSIIYDWEIYPN
jgi:hypothetical protein